VYEIFAFLCAITVSVSINRNVKWQKLEQLKTKEHKIRQIEQNYFILIFIETYMNFPLPGIGIDEELEDETLHSCGGKMNF
jgi:hypothetical protein